MTKTQNPNDPDSLTLTPSGGGAKKADFSNVQGSADTVPGKSGGSGGGSAGGASGRPDFSNVQGSADTVPGNAGATAEQTYTVQKGDTLSHISQQFYGKASRWNRIFEANRDQLDDPDLIKPGQVLKIPQADA